MHCRRPVAVDGRLDKDIAQREHHSLDSGRNTNLEDAPQLHPVDAQMAVVEAERSLLTAKQGDDSGGREGVGYIVGYAHTDDPHLADDHRRQGYYSVDDSGNNQNVQRTARVALAA